MSHAHKGCCLLHVFPLSVNFHEGLAVLPPLPIGCAWNHSIALGTEARENYLHSEEPRPKQWRTQKPPESLLCEHVILDSYVLYKRTFSGIRVKCASGFQTMPPLCTILEKSNFLGSEVLEENMASYSLFFKKYINTVCFRIMIPQYIHS